MKANDSTSKSTAQKSILSFFNNTTSNVKGVKRTYTDLLEGQEDDIKTATQLVKAVFIF
jgi:hypothetical protein